MYESQGPGIDLRKTVLFARLKSKCNELSHILMDERLSEQEFRVFFNEIKEHYNKYYQYISQSQNNKGSKGSVLFLGKLLGKMIEASSFPFKFQQNYPILKQIYDYVTDFQQDRTRLSFDLRNESPITIILGQAILRSSKIFQKEKKKENPLLMLCEEVFQEESQLRKKFDARNYKLRTYEAQVQTQVYQYQTQVQTEDFQKQVYTTEVQTEQPKVYKDQRKVKTGSESKKKKCSKTKSKQRRGSNSPYELPPFQFGIRSNPIYHIIPSANSNAPTVKYKSSFRSKTQSYLGN